MKRTPSPFKWRHFEPELILLCVRWYMLHKGQVKRLEGSDAVGQAKFVMSLFQHAA
ncbi:MAG: hypothetical protein M3430_11260 [Acidobacteriota bacterium]|nr:hypothetical protein [Acidobacteriota bacterium]